jgi:hypothetical protein
MIQANQATGTSTTAVITLPHNDASSVSVMGPSAATLGPVIDIGNSGPIDSIKVSASS